MENKVTIAVIVIMGILEVLVILGYGNRVNKKGKK
jgi:hypothetical protein